MGSALCVYSIPISSFRELFTAPKPQRRSFHVFDLKSTVDKGVLGVLLAN